MTGWLQSGAAQVRSGMVIALLGRVVIRGRGDPPPRPHHLTWSARQPGPTSITQVAYTKTLKAVPLRIRELFLQSAKIPREAVGKLLLKRCGTISISIPALSTIRKLDQSPRIAYRPPNTVEEVNRVGIADASRAG